MLSRAYFSEYLHLSQCYFPLLLSMHSSTFVPMVFCLALFSVFLFLDAQSHHLGSTRFSYELATSAPAHLHSIALLPFILLVLGVASMLLTSMPKSREHIRGIWSPRESLARWQTSVARTLQAALPASDLEAASELQSETYFHSESLLSGIFPLNRTTRLRAIALLSASVILLVLLEVHAVFFPIICSWPAIHVGKDSPRPPSVQLESITSRLLSTALAFVAFLCILVCMLAVFSPSSWMMEESQWDYLRDLPHTLPMNLKGDLDGEVVCSGVNEVASQEFRAMDLDEKL
ncbi:hypothetical protein C8F01DRAFT_1237904 [Mycena amicta]|nr:hypothetical protein C8F01DRAFT_1237904 [Mycena amicta]